MRKTLAAALALALLAPGPSFAAALRAAGPVPSVSLPGVPLAGVAVPALSGVASAASLPSLPGAALQAVPALAAPGSVAAVPEVPAAGPAAPAAPARADLYRGIEKRPAVSASRVSAAASSPAAVPSAESAKASADARFDGAALTPAGAESAAAVAAAPSAPTASGLKKWTARAARAGAAAFGMAAFLTSANAFAIPDGPGPWDFRQVANSGPAPHPVVSAVHSAAQTAAQGDPNWWMGAAIIGGFIATVAAVVWYLRWKDNRQYASSGTRIGDDADSFDAGSIGTAGYVLTSPSSAKGKKGKDAEVEEKRPLFADVAGQDEAKTELSEVVDFLKNPDAYKALHPRYKGPKGVLMFGPPGTGKTLLARAVANEADVPFVHRAGSDFINTYVGTGANNIRAAFEEVRKQIKNKGGAGILFIDEIEAIGGTRSGDSNRSEETRTINALLKEMDGFEKDNIIVIAATNMAESLDPALLRGGRFGTKVPVGLPDVVGREAIFNIHLKGAKLAEDVDAKALARQTPGLAGADLEQIVMDGVKLAKRRKAAAIAQEDLIRAIDEFTTGKQRNLVMSKREKEIVAYHESGHALVSHLLPDADPVRKVTIIPHGLNALGFMQAMPEEEKVLYSYEWLVDRIAVALGGRVAEKMMTGHVYSGAQNDLQQATKLAKHMVMQFGMTDDIGHVSYDMDGQRPAVGGPMSEETRKKIDAEVKRIVHDALARVEKLLEEHRPALQAMADELMEKETLRSEDMERIIAATKGSAAKPPADPKP